MCSTQLCVVPVGLLAYLDEKFIAWNALHGHDEEGVQCQLPFMLACHTLQHHIKESKRESENALQLDYRFKHVQRKREMNLYKGITSEIFGAINYKLHNTPA